MKKRWYDEDATLSLAVSFIKNSNESLKLRCAEFIKEKLSSNIPTSKGMLDNLNKTFVRWYDKEPLLTEAINLLKNASLEDKKTIALEIIEILENAQLEI